MKKPTLFGKYLLLERINVGGMAEVFTAKAFGVEGFERILAIKKILPTMAEDEEFITMFIDEARISVQLNHANVVHIHELGKHEDTYFIAMEYVAGRDLRTLLERYRRRQELMPTAQAVFIASKMCEGLDYAHRKKDARGQDLGIIHRDVSPQNILVSYEGEVKIIDFGIAKAANRSQKTQAGILKGKFGYMSPEQVRGLPTDRRSDVFAVGVILYEMLTGERLFVGESDYSTLEKVRNADVPAPRQFNPNVPAGLEKVMLKALARDVEDRYQWASDLQEDLMRFLLAGDAIYSSKHLAGFMKEVFAEDLVREAEKMERYASIERPEQIETSGVTGDMAPRPTRRPQPTSAGPAAGRTPTAPAQPVPNNYVPPPTEEELAELDGAGEKTQIAESPFAMRPEPSKPSSPSSGSSVLVDESLTSEDSTLPPVPRDRVVRGTGARPQQVIIGDESEGYSGATVVGLAPTAPPAEANATRVGQIESGSTMISPMPTGQRTRLDPKELRHSSSARDEEQDAEQDEQQLSGSRGSVQELDEEEKTGPIALNQEEEPEPEPEPVPQKAKPVPQKVPSRAVSTGKKAPPKALLGVAAAVVLVLLLGVGFMLFSGPRTGSLMISVQPEGAELRINGQVVTQGQVIELPEGSHKLTATAPGHLSAEQMVAVSKGQTPQVVSVTLEAEPPADQAPAGNDTQVADTGTGTGTGTGTQGALGTPSSETGSKTEPQPQTASATGTGTATATPPAPVEPPKPAKPTKFTVTFSGDSGADIEVDGRRVGKTPDAQLANLTIGATYTFTAKRAGYKTYSGKFRSKGDTELDVSFSLEKDEPAAPPPERERQATKSQPAPKNTVTKASSKSSAKGKLACSSRPLGAQIWVDGKYTGRDTPAGLGSPLVLPVGSHTVIFKIGGKQSKPQQVDITDGGMAKLVNVPIE
jgi:serine/threonine protein kinase